MELEFRVVKGKGDFAGMFRLEPMSWLTAAEITKLKLQGEAQVKLWALRNEQLTGKVL